MPRDFPDYSQAESDKLTREGDQWLIDNARRKHLAKYGYGHLPCNCQQNDVVELCPQHGNLAP